MKKSWNCPQIPLVIKASLKKRILTINKYTNQFEIYALHKFIDFD